MRTDGKGDLASIEKSSTFRAPRTWIALGILVVLAMLPTATAHAAVGFESLSSTFSTGGEAISLLGAGSHPDLWTASIAFDENQSSGERRIDGYVKNLRIELPPGLIANPTPVPQCPHVDFLADDCPSSSAVGSIEMETDLSLGPSTVFLLEPVSGELAELGFWIKGQFPVTIQLSISPSPPYPLIGSLTNVSQAAQLFGLTMKLEGSPGGNAFLTLPRACSGPLLTTFTASAWEEPDVPVIGTAPEDQSLVECAALPYSPTLEVAPTTTAASSPSGLDLNFDVPDEGLASFVGRAAADTRSSTITLPPGFTVNPAVAAGLDACTAAELAAEEAGSEPGQGCPVSANLGTASVTTPLFPGSMAGTIYLARPEGASSALVTDASGSHLSLDLVLRDAERGVLIAVPVGVDADPQDGRLTASLEEIPQIPISHLELHFNGGPRAPLTTPAGCGSHSINYSLAPSSGNPPTTGSQPFVTTAPECSPAFAPSFTAGTVSNAAARSSAFVFELSQPAASPNLSGFDITLPSGLSAAFGSVATCPEGQASSGDCPSASKLGYARIALGSGPEPLWVPVGEAPESAVYLAGPYKGAPYSFVIVVPGQAGPFDLGNVVLRAPITINPTTAQASLTVEGLPQILSGVPLHYRTIRVVLDRPGFIRNPTSCEPTAITGTAEAADGSSAAISSRFQAADCTALGFGPKLSLRFSGAVGRTGHPTVRAVLRSDPGGTAMSSAKIVLPRGELLDLRHLRGLCPRSVPVGGCPKSSRLGNLRLVTSLLDRPLEGPVYLRVPRHRLPEVSAELRSGQLSFDVDGRVTAASGRVGVNLESIPDVPLTEAVLSLPGGRKGIIVNSSSLCGSQDKAAATFTAQNGRRLQVGVRARVKGRC